MTWVAGYIPRWFISSQTVTHLGTNRVWRSAIYIDRGQHVATKPNCYGHNNNNNNNTNNSGQQWIQDSGHSQSLIFSRTGCRGIIAIICNTRLVINLCTSSQLFDHRVDSFIENTWIRFSSFSLALLTLHSSYYECVAVMLVIICRCQQWLKNCGRYDLLHYPSRYLHENRRLCSRHFHRGMFFNSRLVNNALPTIFKSL